MIDTARATLAVRLARLAYRDTDAAEAGVTGLGLGDFRFFSGTSTEGFLVSDATTVYVAFRGTETDKPIDWIRDAQFFPTSGELGTDVHSGFHAALDEVWNQITSTLGDTGNPVLVTGHSLGGALATLAAARLHQSGRSIEGVYTFGQPRTGLGAFAKAFDRRLGTITYRFVNHIDLVTRVPLLVQGYRHVGRRMYFDESGGFHLDASTWKVAIDDLKYRLRHFGRIESIGLGSHEIPRYEGLVSGL